MDECKLARRVSSVARKLGKVPRERTWGFHVQQYYFDYSNKFGGFEVLPSDLRGLIDPQSMCGAYKK